MSGGLKTLELIVRGVPIEVVVDHDLGEPAIGGATDQAHPRTAAQAILVACRVGDQDIYGLLKPPVIQEIEDAAMAQLEG